MDWSILLALYTTIAIVAVCWWSRAPEAKHIGVFFGLVALSTISKLVITDVFPTGNLFGIIVNMWSVVGATLLLFTGAYVVARLNTSQTARLAALYTFIVVIIGTLIMGLVAASSTAMKTALLVTSSVNLVAMIGLLVLAGYALLQRNVSLLTSVGFIIILAGISPFRRFFPNTIADVFTIICLVAILVGTILDARAAQKTTATKTETTKQERTKSKTSKKKRR